MSLEFNLSEGQNDIFTLKIFSFKVRLELQSQNSGPFRPKLVFLT